MRGRPAGRRWRRGRETRAERGSAVTAGSGDPPPERGAGDPAERELRAGRGVGGEARGAASFFGIPADRSAGGSWAEMVRRRASRSIGLARKPLQPAARHFSSSPFMAFAVRAMIGMVTPSRRRRVVAAYPSMTGICMSIRTTSNGWVPARSTASLPLVASSTSPPARSSTIRISRRLASPSSTTSTRVPARVSRGGAAACAACCPDRSRS